MNMETSVRECVRDKLQAITAIFPWRFIRNAVLLSLTLLWKNV